MVPSKIANWIIARVTGVQLSDFGCTLKAYRREVVDDVKLYGEMHRFIPVFAAMVGARITELPVNHRPRTYGKSKYSLTRTSRVMLDLITVKLLGSYSTKPMYFFGFAAFVLWAIAFVLAAIVILQKVLPPYVYALLGTTFAGYSAASVPDPVSDTSKLPGATRSGFTI